MAKPWRFIQPGMKRVRWSKMSNVHPTTTTSGFCSAIPPIQEETKLWLRSCVVPEVKKTQFSGYVGGARFQTTSAHLEWAKWWPFRNAPSTVELTWLYFSSAHQSKGSFQVSDGGCVMSLKVTNEIVVYTQSTKARNHKPVCCVLQFLGHFSSIFWMHKMVQWVTTKFGIIIYWFFPFILAEPSKTNIFRSGIRRMYPFIVDSPREMSVCQGKETHFPLELWPVAPIQFGWPVLATFWIGVLGVFVGAGPVQSRLQCLDASVVSGLRTLVFCIARLLHLPLPNTSTPPVNHPGWECLQTWTHCHGRPFL